MPRYWKRNGKRELRVIIRNNCYIQRLKGKAEEYGIEVVEVGEYDFEHLPILWDEGQ